ncbi:MAG: GAF domain-containing protein [Chloroflexota bacterium]|nr:GAF domain-containing protein [Chloroflexota bacterium]
MKRGPTPTPDTEAGLERRLLIAETLLDLAQRMTEAPNLDEALDLITSAALRVVPTAQRAVIHTLVEDRLVSQAAAPSRLYTVKSARMKLGRGVAGRVATERRPIYVPDTASEPSFIDTDSGLRSLLVVPLMRRNTVLGTLSAGSTQIAAFTAEDEQALSALAAQTVVALEIARLDAQAGRAGELAALNALAAALSSSLDLEHILTLAVEGISHTLGAKVSLLMLAHGSEGQIDARWVVQRSVPFTDPPPALEKCEAIRRVLSTGKALHLTNNPDDEPLRNELSRVLSVPCRTALLVPLVVRERVLGAAAVAERLDEAQFQEDDLALLGSIAASVAMAVENAHLYAEVKGVAEELEASQEQLVQSEKLAAMGKLAASVAHEINNPLQAVQSCIYLVAENAEPSDPNTRYLEIARQELNRIASIVQRMLDFYRPGDEGRRPTAVEALLDDVLTLMRKQLEQGHVQVQTAYDPDLPRVMAIADHLKQVFLNIILNALEAMPNGGTLQVRTGTEQVNDGQRMVIISFQDTGVGIPESDVDQIFEPFYSTRPDGTGLGLSISYDIVARHGGRIEVESQVGQGSTFTVILPSKSDTRDDEKMWQAFHDE